MPESSTSRLVNEDEPMGGWPRSPWDWAWRSDDPNSGPSARYWTYRDQSYFDALWTPAGDRLADALADAYQFAWPWLSPDALTRREPELASTLRALATSGRVASGYYLNQVTEAIYDHVAQYGPFHALRRRRNWAAPAGASCGACGQNFWQGDPPYWTYRQFGVGRFCPSCCMSARTGAAVATWEREPALAALRHLGHVLEAIPSPDFSWLPIPTTESDERRDRWVQALQRTPPVEILKSVTNSRTWLEVLISAKLVDSGGWRPSMGTYCLAVDRHPCNSLLERSVDDWLFAHQIIHEKEPHWPVDPDFNPGGHLRADWKLDDGTMIECAGLLHNTEYRSKIAIKRALALRLDIPLIVIAPTDMQVLATVFGRWLGGSRCPRPGKLRVASSTGSRER